MGWRRKVNHAQNVLPGFELLMQRETLCDLPVTNGNAIVVAPYCPGAGLSVFVSDWLYGLETLIIGRLRYQGKFLRPPSGFLSFVGLGTILESLYKEPYRTSTMLLLLRYTLNAGELLTSTSSACRNARNASMMSHIMRGSGSRRRKTSWRVAVPPTTSASTPASKGK